MNFCCIGPLAARGLFEHHSHHMALAQYLYDEQYFAFFSNLAFEGKTVILDSGVYEGSAVDDRQLLYWCQRIQPTAVILPDKPHDAAETFKRSCNFTQMLDDAGLTGIKKWKVLHAADGDLAAFTQSYIYDSRLFDGVCFSRLTRDFGTLAETHKYSRPSFIHHLKEKNLWNKKAYHHALGMADGSREEFNQLKHLGIDSCDSSAPIWRGWHTQFLSSASEPFHTAFDPWAANAPTNTYRLEHNLSSVGVKQPALTPVEAPVMNDIDDDIPF